VDQPGHPKEDVVVRERNHVEVDGLFVVVDLAVKADCLMRDEALGSGTIGQCQGLRFLEGENDAMLTVLTLDLWGPGR